MTLREVLNRVAAQTGEDLLDDEAHMLAIDYIAEAYDEMMCIYKPYIDITVPVPSSGILAMEALGEQAGRVVQVFVRNMERPFDLVTGGVLVMGAAGGDAVFRCRYIPRKLAHDGDTAELPKAFAGSLADYASYRLMQGGGKARQQRGEVYFSRYLQRKATLAPESQIYRDHIGRKYG